MKITDLLPEDQISLSFDTLRDLIKIGLVKTTDTYPVSAIFKNTIGMQISFLLLSGEVRRL